MRACSIHINFMNAFFSAFSLFGYRKILHPVNGLVRQRDEKRWCLAEWRKIENDTNIDTNHLYPKWRYQRFYLKYVAENDPENIFKLCFPRLNTKNILLNAGIEFSEPSILQTIRPSSPNRVHDPFDPLKDISFLRDIANLPIKD